MLVLFDGQRFSAELLVEDLFVLSIVDWHLDQVHSAALEARGEDLGSDGGFLMN